MWLEPSGGGSRCGRAARGRERKRCARLRCGSGVAFDDAILPVRLTDATLELQPDGAATLAGRWSVPDLLSVAPELGVCRDSDNYRVLSRVLDLTSDVRAVPGSGGPGVVCDAASLGLAFSVVRVPAVDVGAAPDVAPLCP